MFKVFEDNETYIFSNPRSSVSITETKNFLKKVDKPLVWFATSGTENMKWIGLTRDALLASARAVNNHLNITHNDRWIKALPSFHVGGFGIYARAFLSKSEVIEIEKWSPDEFYEELHKNKATLTSLVPTQVYDLVLAKIEAPNRLRAVIVGGAALPESLYLEGRKLGWPLLPSYGMTECASQIATASLKSLDTIQYPSLDILEHIQSRLNHEKFLEIKSSSLFIYCTHGEKIESPFNDGWYTSQDIVELKDNTLKVLGRESDCFKIGSEKVYLSNLENKWLKACLEEGIAIESMLVALPDDRLGHSIHLYAVDPNKIDQAVQKYNLSVMPFEKIRSIRKVDVIPRTCLGKIKKIK